MNLVFLCIGIVLTAVEGKLLGVQLLSRHGNRAPNPEVFLMCPNEISNVRRYLDMNISLEAVTGRGMQQMYELGEFTRQTYVAPPPGSAFAGFMKPYYSAAEVYMHAVGTQRTLQSAIAFAHGVFPPGTAPADYNKGYLPDPVPVYSVPAGEDNLLEARKSGCKRRLARDMAEWDASTGRDLYSHAGYRELIATMSRLCGFELDDTSKSSADEFDLEDAIKVVSDAFVFDLYEHFPMHRGLSEKLIYQFSSLAAEQLQGRLYSTADQRTYMAGDLPLVFLANFRRSIKRQMARIKQQQQKPPSVAGMKPVSGDQWSAMDLELQTSEDNSDDFVNLDAVSALWNANQHYIDSVKPLGKMNMRFWSFHGHREILYAIGAMLDLNFTAAHPGLGMPRGVLPPAATIFFELHQDDAATADSDPSALFFVRIKLWTPCEALHGHAAHLYETGTSIFEVCPSVTIQAKGCATDCPFTTFQAIILDQIAATGCWQELCHFNSNAARLNKLEIANGSLTHALIFVSICSVVLLGVVVWLYRWSVRHSAHEYHEIPGFSDEREPDD